MKRITAFVIFLSLLLFFCACGGGDDNKDSSSFAPSLVSQDQDITSEGLSENMSDYSSDTKSDAQSFVSETESSADSSAEISNADDESSWDTSVQVSVDDSSDASEDISVEDSSEPDISEESTDISNDESEDQPVYTLGDAELIPTGYVIYNGAAYSAARYNSVYSQYYADVYARYAELFPNTRISAVNHPLSIMSVKNPLVCELLPDQGEVLDAMESHIYGDVNFVNLKDIFTEHKGEYLYFKSDFHWTQLGAYYAYVEFARSVGLNPTPLSWFEKKTVTTNFVGRTYEYAGDERILSFVDTVYAYMPRKKHTMKVYDSGFNLIGEYGNCIRLSKESYSCFTMGDQAYIEINVPQNDQDRTVLVIKESSANAFVPFLTEHYGNIIVIDPRMLVFDIKNLVANRGVDDIIFFATASTSNSPAYQNYYKKLISEYHS